MGANPTKAAGNVYCQCRKKAAKYNERLNSREGAAELLGYSSSSVAGWELGTDRPSPEAILLMVDLYHAPELRSGYCRNICPLGQDVPEINMLDLDRISVKALCSFKKIAETRDLLLDITEDGVIDDSEKADMQKVLHNLEELESVAQNLKVWVKKNL